MKKPRSRRYFLWDTVQPRLVTLSLFYQIVIVAAVAGALFIPLTLQLDLLAPASHDAPSVAGEFLFLHSRFWPLVLGATLFVMLHSIVFFHRIAGPLYRFRQIFREVARGDLVVRTSIRRGDYLHAEAECLGAMIASLQNRISHIEGYHHDMILAMDRLRAAIGRSSLSEVKEETGQLELMLERLSEALKFFRLKSLPDCSVEPLLASTLDQSSH